MRCLITAVFMSVWLGGCQSPAPVSLPPLSADFFVGRTQGQGVIVHRDGGVDRAFTVESEGQRTAGGDIVIDQTITFGDGEVRTRKWVITAAGEGRWTGSLSDAGGQIFAEQQGGALRISYPLAELPMARMEQFLYRRANGNIAVNTGTVRVMGVTVRRLHETITRLPEGQLPSSTDTGS